MISYEQATKLENVAIASIEEASKKIQQIITSAPVIDMVRFNKEMEGSQRQTKAKAEEMRQKIEDSLERAGFHPVYSNS